MVAGTTVRIRRRRRRWWVLILGLVIFVALTAISVMGCSLGSLSLWGRGQTASRSLSGVQVEGRETL